MMLYGEGPKEQWRAELERVNVHGLRILIDGLIFELECYRGPGYKATLLERVRNAKKFGKWDAKHASFMRLMADPLAYARTSRRRSRSAKRAARRRKRMVQ